MAVRTFRIEGVYAVEVPIVADGLDGVSRHLPPGAYTTFRTYAGDCVFMLTEHLLRLEASARREGQPRHVEQPALKRALAVVVNTCGWRETRLRITLCYDAAGSVYVSAEEFVPLPDRLYRQGVACALADPTVLRAVPEAKSTSFIAQAVEARAQQPAAHEVLLTDREGRILEGTSSNFFAVCDGTLRTAGAGVLQGTTRAQVLALAKALLPVRLDPVTVAELGTVGEAFITSVSRGVLPVVSIAGMSVADGRPGSVTLQLHDRLAQATAAYLERLVLQAPSVDSGAG